MADVAPLQIPATILVIDDDMSVQMLAAQALRNEGYHVLVAADMDEALRVSGEYAPDIDLVLTDIVLPTGNGMTLARALQRTRPNTPVLYMSGFGAEAIQAIQYEGGPNGGFLEKPFLPRVLIERVRQLLPAGNHDPDGRTRPSDHRHHLKKCRFRRQTRMQSIDWRRRSDARNAATRFPR